MQGGTYPDTTAWGGLWLPRPYSLQLRLKTGREKDRKEEKTKQTGFNTEKQLHLSAFSVFF